MILKKLLEKIINCEGTVKTIHYKSIDASNELGNHLFILLLELLSAKKFKSIKVVCIGTDRASGDCLGPLVGTFLSQNLNLKYINILGTIDNPVHAQNIEDIVSNIKNDELVIAVDASLTPIALDLGNINLAIGPLMPGAGIEKKLAKVGHVYMTGTVGYSTGYSSFDYLGLTAAHLGMIYETASVIFNSIKNAFLELDNYIKNNNDLGIKLKPIYNSINENMFDYNIKQYNKFKTQLNRRLVLLKEGKYKSIVILNLGNAKGTGYSFGPIIGTKLTKHFNHSSIRIFGTLEKPFTEVEMEEVIQGIDSDDFVITTNSYLTFNRKKIGKIKVCEEDSIFIEESDKKIIKRSDLNIMGLINISTSYSSFNSEVKRSTRLSEVLKMAKVVAESLRETLPNYLPYLENNENWVKKKR